MSNVTPLTRRLSLRLGAPKVRSYRSCGHTLAVVDEHARRVVCDVCGVELDPIKVLRNIANDAMWVESLKMDRLKSKRALEDLQRRIKNARAACARWENRRRKP